MFTFGASEGNSGCWEVVVSPDLGYVSKPLDDDIIGISVSLPDKMLRYCSSEERLLLGIATRMVVVRPPVGDEYR